MCAGVLLIGMIPLLVQAQNAPYEVKGVVVDQSGMPILGATVVERGTINGVSTGLDGDYSLNVSNSQAIVEVSYVGYKTVALAANSTLLRQVTLETDAMGLDEVVVIGYGTVRKEDLTGSVVAVKAEEINRGAVVSPQEMIRGKIPGVQVIPGDGGPGSGATIRLRGTASLRASSNPLIVIDGIPIADDGGKGMSNPLASLNPNDIEAMTVLKDASAAAIYGSRASNGVIMITTKKGRLIPGSQVNTLNVSYNGSVSVETNSNELPVMRPGEFREFVNTVYPAGSSATADRVQSMVGTFDTNYQDMVFRTALSTDHNISVFGAVKDRMPYRASAGYTNQQGTLETSHFDRWTLDMSASPNFFDNHLTVNLNAKGTSTSQRYADGGVVGAAAFYNPTIDPYWRTEYGSIDYTTTNGYWSYGTGRGSEFQPNTLLGAGPLSLLHDRENRADAKRFIGNAQIDYKVHGFEALRFNLNLGVDWSMAEGRDGVNPGSFQAYADTEAPGTGQYSKWTNLRRNRLLEFYADFNKQWGIHRLNVMAGYSWQHFYASDRSVSYFNADDSQKGEDARYPFNRQENFLLSFYGRLNYTINSKYLFTFTLRDDASSRFSPDTRWHIFPSAAFAWNIAQENFLKDARGISALKLRLGAGQTGQQEIGNNYPYLARYTLSTNEYERYNMGDAGYMLYLTPQDYDAFIQWETVTTYNVGLDFGFLDGRINGSIDWYHRATSDLLSDRSMAMGAGFGNRLLTNIGTMRNTGLEFALNVIPVATKDWTLQIGLNGTVQNTEVTKLSGIGDPAADVVEVSGISSGTGNRIARHMIGYAPYTFYTYKQLYDSNGHPIQNAFVDRDGNGSIGPEDRYMTGKSPNPDFFYGVNVSLRYRNWDFGFNGHGSVGNFAFNDFASGHSTSSIDINAGNLPNFARSVKKTGFTRPNDSAQWTSDLFLENASFFRMDDINLGYTFRDMSGWKGSMRLAFSVQNVFVITNYSGVDPEIPGVEGVDGAIWPRPRTYSLRLNVNF